MDLSRDAKEFGRAFVNANVSMEPPEVSVLWFFWYVKSCGGSKRIWEVENGGQVRICCQAFLFFVTPKCINSWIAYKVPQ